MRIRLAGKGNIAMASRELQSEVDANFDAFQEKLSELMISEPDRWALMKGGECIAFYDTLRDAMAAGNAQFEDGLFSVQEVTTREIDLGWFSHAVY